MASEAEVHHYDLVAATALGCLFMHTSIALPLRVEGSKEGIMNAYTTLAL